MASGGASSYVPCMDRERPVTEFLKRHVSKAAVFGLLGIFWLAFAALWWMLHDPRMHQTTWWRYLSVAFAAVSFLQAFREWRKSMPKGLDG